MDNMPKQRRRAAPSVLRTLFLALMSAIVAPIEAVSQDSAPLTLGPSTPEGQHAMAADSPGWRYPTAGLDGSPPQNDPLPTPGARGISYLRMAALDSDTVQPDRPVPELDLEPTPGCADGYSGNPFKSVRLTSTWLAGSDLGFTDIELTSEWEFPTISQYSLLTLTPGYGLHLVDGPATPDLPGRLHDISLDLEWVNPLSEEWAIELGLTPGLYSDFKQGTDKAFRLGARIVGYYTVSPELRFAAGIAFLDRKDEEFFPLGGIVWTPDADTSLELVLPRPKYAHRFNQCGDTEDWWYIAGEFGGGSWAVERATGVVDVANYRDWRLAVGWEHQAKAGPSGLFEVGYVLDRHLEYNSGGVFTPDNAFLIRATIGF
jgi:hypothetical protein